VSPTSGGIPGVAWGRINAHGDDRGTFREVWRASKHLGRFVQANLSLSKAGVLRGLHYHERQLDHWVVLDGEVFVALVDLRTDNGARPRVVTRALAQNQTVTIPEGVAHGFLAVLPTSLLYMVTNEYDGSDEHGLAWDDPALGVQWPRVATADGRPILSDRDRSNPLLSELPKTLD
jgi:dTDP-4-dehydrorhamnose 3,5-epimerase